MMWILRALWLVVAHDLSEYRYMDDITRNLLFFVLFNWRAVLKMFVRLFPIKASESLEKISTGAIYKKEKWRNGTKRSLDYFSMTKLQEIFKTAATVFHHYERLAVLQNVFAIILLWARKDVEKLFKETVYNWDKEKKKKQRQKVALGTLKKMPKLEQILEQSNEAGMCIGLFFFWSLYKTNRFHVAVGLFGNTSQRTSKCGKNISDTLACGSCATSLFLPHFDVICDLLLNRQTAARNLLVKHSKHQAVNETENIAD